MSFDFLIHWGESPRIQIRLFYTPSQEHPEQILKWDSDHQNQWIRGFFDAEGSITKNSENQTMLSIYNNEKRKLEIIRQVLNAANIKSGLYKHPERNTWQLFITGRTNLQNFLKTIGIDHPEKQKKIKEYLKN